MEAGYIEQDTPLHDFIETCGRPETGEYLFNAGGCIVHDTKGSKPGPEKSHCYQDGEGESLSENCITMEDMPDGLNDPRSMQAMSVFMIDLQVIQSLNGEDDEALLETPESSGSDLDGEVIDTPSKDGWSSPMNAPITFGYHKTGRRGLHKGIDFGAPRGTPVYSAHDGEVTMVRDMGSCGWATAITAEGVNGIWHAYQHMDPSVKVGDRVRRGQQIGVVGRFCGSGHHLHFSIETANRVSAYTDSGANDTSKDPALYLPSGGS